MRYNSFENIMSAPRLNRYLLASNGDTKKAMVLYRKNLQLSQELFTVISCFEIALRNAIDTHYKVTIGNSWLRNSARQGGIFDNRNCRSARVAINDSISLLGSSYTHDKLLAEMRFGFWRYLFANHQYRVAGRNLLRIFPSKPRSTPVIQYNQTYIFNRLAEINGLRNRIAHHEPVCFLPLQAVKDTTYARHRYGIIIQLFQWMNIDSADLLYGIDHITRRCGEIDSL